MVALVLAAVLLATPPAGDDFTAPLARLAARAPRDPSSIDALATLGQLHYARGEYRQAAETFARLGKVGGSRALEGRYREGLAWLGLGEPSRARGAFEAAAARPSRWRAAARVGLAAAYEAEGRPERALVELDALLGDEPGDESAPALGRRYALAASLQRPDAAASRERLLREYPRSVEAMRLRGAAPASATPVTPGGASTNGAARFRLQLGAFAELGRARELAEAALRAGLAPVSISDADAAGLHVVRAGAWATREEALRGRDRAAHALATAARVVLAP